MSAQDKIVLSFTKNDLTLVEIYADTYQIKVAGQHQKCLENVWLIFHALSSEVTIMVNSRWHYYMLQCVTDI